MQDRELYRQILASKVPGKSREWSCAEPTAKSTSSSNTTSKSAGRAANAAPCAHSTIISPNAAGVTSTPVSTARSCTPGRRAATAPSTGRASCDCPGPRLPAASPRCLKLSRSRGLKEASQQGIAELLALSWDEIHGILERAVQRGSNVARQSRFPTWASTEKSFRKRHRYLTVVNDLNRSRVLFVAEGRRQASLDGFWKTLSAEQLARVEAVAMDMWDPYVASTREHLDESEKKIVYDKYHIAAHLAKAGGPSAAGGEQAFTGPRRRTFDRHEVRLAAASGELFRGRLARVPRAARKRLENGAGVGVEGNGDAAVRLSSRIGGASFLRAMARLGESQPADADGHRSADVDGSASKTYSRI